MTREEFKYYFDAMYPVICMFSQGFVSDARVAEDIAQECFIKCWQERRKLHSEGEVKAFLYTMARARSINSFNHNQFEKNYLNELKTESFFKEQVIEHESFSELRVAISKLPVQQKKVIEWSMKGLKNPEIAIRMDISITSVKSHKKSAFRTLKKELNNDFLLLIIACYLGF